MRVLVIMDPISQVQPERDTTFGLLLAAQARGHELYICEQEQLYTIADQAWAELRPVQVWERPQDFFALGPPTQRSLKEFHSIWMRKDPPVDPNYLHATQLLDCAHTQVLNRPSGLRSANEKLYALRFPELIPETRVSRSPGAILSWLEARQEPLIVKPLDGHGGYGIFLLKPGDRNAPSVLEMLGERGLRWIMAQAYLPAAREGDKRIILLDGEPLGAILRVPGEEENRGNIHVGGRVERSLLTPRDLEICATLAPSLRADGLSFVGIDVIGEFLTEVNVTSPTGIREIKALGGRDIADDFVAWVEAQV